MNFEDRQLVEMMIKEGIEKSKEVSWADIIVGLLVVLVVSVVFLIPLAEKVAIPYWYEVTGWVQLAPK